MNEVSVEIFDGVSGDELKQKIESHLDDGFYIQDSQVEWYQGTVMGVYVFVKTAAEKTCDIGIDFDEGWAKSL